MDKAVSAENLQAAAARATDPQVLLGLAILVPTEGSVRRSLSELAVKARPDYDPILAMVAITMDGPDFCNRWFAQRALESAFGLKAEVAHADKSARKYGYAAAAHALFGAAVRWPGFEHAAQPSQLARWLPTTIHRAFAVADPARFHAGEFGYEMNLKLPDSDKPAFEKAKENAARTAAALLEAALSDPDGIVGPYLKGIPQRGNHADDRQLIHHTPVEQLLNERPDLLKAAAANKEAMMALWRAGDNDPGRANGVFELWISGGLEARLEGLNWQGAYSDYGINTVFLENYWNDGAPQPQERYFDNFVVSTQRIGC